MEDTEVIDKFKQQISWGNETELINHGDRVFMDSGLVIYVPVHWNHFILEDVQVLERYYQRKIAVLVYGNPSDRDVKRIFWKCSAAGIYTVWIDVEASIEWGRLVMSSLDGVDWQRSIEAIAEHGMDARPVYEWEA